MPVSLSTPPPPLNLPPAELSLRPGNQGVEVYDVLRRKWVVLTSEEWVRQHFVRYLIDYQGFPASMMANEIGITLNSMSRRCDTVVYSRALEPLMIVEYKAPSVKICRSVFEQVIRYNIVLRVPYLVVSNGMTHYCMKVDAVTHRCEMLTSIPAYTSL